MRLDECSPKEAALLVALVALSLASDPVPIRGRFRYLEAIAELRRTYFRIPGKKLAHKDRGCQPFGRGSVPTRTIRARERYGR